MRTATIAFVLLGIAVCSCSRTPTVQLQVGDDPTWITHEEARRVGERFVGASSPQARLVEESVTGQTGRYVFATDDTAMRLTVLVDRKTGKAKFER